MKLSYLNDGLEELWDTLLLFASSFKTSAFVGTLGSGKKKEIDFIDNIIKYTEVTLNMLWIVNILLCLDQLYESF